MSITGLGGRAAGADAIVNAVKTQNTKVLKKKKK
jgi:hypothetical protein